MKKLLILFLSFMGTALCQNPSHERIKYWIEHNKLDELEDVARKLKLTETRKAEYLDIADKMVDHQVKLNNLYGTISPVNKTQFIAGSLLLAGGITLIYKSGRKFIEGVAADQQGMHNSAGFSLMFGALGINGGLISSIAGIITLIAAGSKVSSHKQQLKQLSERHENAIAIKELFSKLKPVAS